MNTPKWVVMHVQPQTDYTLHLTFACGEQRIYNARPLLEKSLYAQLRNPSFFMTAKAEYGTVVWDDDIDIAPEHLYDASTPI